ncbi:MAG: YeiH family protein [Candidatus Velthaea sp.]
MEQVQKRAIGLPFGLSQTQAAGVAVCAFVAFIATLGGHLAPLIGAPVIAIVLGVAIRAYRPLPAALAPGVAFTGKKVLQAAIVVSGFSLSFLAVVHTGVTTLPVTLATIAVALILAPLLGRLLRVRGVLQTLIGVGTAICGASAIAAVSSVLEPDEEQMALAIATIFLYNVAAVLIFPPLGHLMSLGQMAFGVWAGTAINDTSSVVAAGYAYGADAGAHATIVKLTRATFILPIVGAIAVMHARAVHSHGTKVPWMSIVPWFIVWFLGAALINTTGVVPVTWHDGITAVAAFLIAMALAAIGLQTNFVRLIHAGARPLALGFCLWVAVAVTSLIVQHATGT